MGNFVKTYSPEETASYENLVKLCYMAAATKEGKSDVVLGEPVCVNVMAFFPVPKSYPKRMREATEPFPYTKKPDADNIGKIVCDSLNGVAWKDDSLVFMLTVSKHYSNFQNPCVAVSISTTKEEVNHEC
jgi:Holliday junction resolvase RusA-like endonuclease